jgi:alpha-tubulin suppressor-like RCC1 family protein
VAAGGFAGYALLGSARVWAWGDDLEGQVGPGGGWGVSVVPVEVPGLAGTVAIAAGENTAYALRRSGAVWAWGDDGQDELGDTRGVARDVPAQILGLPRVIAIAAGAASAYALQRDGVVWAWGDNALGQLGSGSLAAAPVPPHEVRGLGGVVAIAGGTSDGYALRRDGTVWAWGDGTFAQLGPGPCPGSRSAGLRCPGSDRPLRVRGLSRIVAIAAGADTAYALRRDGSVWAWGAGGEGQLGKGVRRMASPVPARIPRLTHVVAVAAGGDTGYAVGPGGRLWAWGDGTYGQLGDGSRTSTDAPVRVRAAAVTAVAGGGDMAYAWDRAGSLWAWGDDTYGQLGDGGTAGQDMPVRVGPTPRVVDDFLAEVSDGFSSQGGRRAT